MCKLHWVLFSACVFVCLCCASLWAQGARQVFVSTGAAGPIYSIDTATSTVSPLITNPGADFEGMVVAPYNVGQTSTDESTHYLVYVCDTANNRVWRFDPGNPASLEKIYDNNAGLTKPQCGRITSTGDLVVSSTAAGSGLWVFSGVTNLALGSGVQTPTALVAVAGSSEGVAQKNQGDLLVVDNTNGKVLRTPLAPAATKTFISGLSQPFGIARRGDGGIFVGTQGNKANLVQYSAQGTNPTTCINFRNNTPNFMQMALDNTLYVAVAGNTAGTVRSINANTCQQNPSFSIPQPAIGIALAPSMTASQNVTTSNGTAIVNFGFAAFELNQIVGACSGSVSVGLASPAAIDTLILNSGVPATPAVNLGLDGFEALFSTASLNGCAAGNAGSGVSNFQMSNLLSPGVVNPEIVVCTEPNVNPTNCQPQSTSLAQIGGWPVGGYLPNDLTSGGSKSLKCRIFMANALPVAGAQGQEAGIFCGFQSPLSNTFTGTLNSWNLALAANITDGKSVPVKIKLASASGSCQNGPYVTDATAILAVAQILDSKGSNVFVPIGLISNGSSGLGQPLFKGDNNQQYLFNWDSSSCIMPSGVTQVCPKGTYSVSVLFLTNNTAGGAQSIYGAQTTLVNLK
jgi:sugar lactone lactonase YvrE